MAYTLEAFDQYVVRCRAQPDGQEPGLTFAGPLPETAQAEIPIFARELSVRIWIQPPD